MHALGVLHSVRNVKYLISIQLDSQKKQTYHLLIPDLLDIEKTTFCANISLAEVLHPIDDDSADSEGDTIVV